MCWDWKDRHVSTSHPRVEIYPIITWKSIIKNNSSSSSSWYDSSNNSNNSSVEGGEYGGNGVVALGFTAPANTTIAA
jgi:hypothetical protein